MAALVGHPHVQESADVTTVGVGQQRLDAQARNVGLGALGVADRRTEAYGHRDGIGEPIDRGGDRARSRRDLRSSALTLRSMARFCSSDSTTMPDATGTQPRAERDGRLSGDAQRRAAAQPPPSTSTIRPSTTATLMRL